MTTRWHFSWLWCTRYYQITVPGVERFNTDIQSIFMNKNTFWMFIIHRVILWPGNQGKRGTMVEFLGILNYKRLCPCVCVSVSHVTWQFLVQWDLKLGTPSTSKIKARINFMLTSPNLQLSSPQSPVPAVPKSWP